MLHSNMKESLAIDIATWMDLKEIVLNEKRPITKTTYYLIPFL